MIDVNVRRATKLGVALAGVALALQACSTPTRIGTAPSSSADVPSQPAASSAAPSAPSPSASSSPASSSTVSSSPRPKPPATTRGAIFEGKRQVWLLPPLTEGTLAVGRDNVVDLSDDFGDRALFALVPTSPGSKKYLIKTAKIQKGGEPLCLSIKSNGSKPLSLVATLCDAGKNDQLFTFTDAGKNDAGKPTYRIGASGGIFLSAGSTSGLVVEEVGDGPAPTGFLLPDKGAARLPALD